MLSGLRSFIFFIISAFGILSFAAATDEATLLSKQIAWTAANLDNPHVVSQFKNTFAKTKLETVEGKKIQQQGQNLLAVINLRAKLEECKLEQAGSLGIREAINKALGTQATQTGDPCLCDTLGSQVPQVMQFKSALDVHFKEEARDQILKNAEANLKNTKSYWTEVEKQDATDLAVSLTEKEMDMAEHTPSEGAELLLYTDAISKRVNKNYVSKDDVKKAFNEVQTELKSNAEYLNAIAQEKPEEALKKLITTNPGAVAQYLLAHPESLDLICSTLQSLDSAMARNEKIDKAFFWGGLVIAGVLIATGVGALAGGALAGTVATVAAGKLAAVAAGAALVGTATGVGDAVYSSNKTHQAFIEAQNIRSSSFAEGLSSSARERIDKANDKAYEELQGAGFATLSIIPFGAGFKIMKSAAMSAKLGSLSRVAKEGAKVEAESVSGIAKTLQEISSDKEVLRILEKNQSAVSEEQMGEFLGYLSTLSAKEKEQVFKAIKEKPDKLAAAIKESSQKEICK